VLSSHVLDQDVELATLELQVWKPNRHPLLASLPLMLVLLIAEVVAGVNTCSLVCFWVLTFMHGNSTIEMLRLDLKTASIVV